ncbi:hypothetical protein [Prauserella muralis]|uniref:Uncharacterized protein n=1 Tax=Prauserella muralis TaxID=588067 RepID=A0A2V4AHV3_9PSEU|nr:hypothetical protein [Prauserella muralis]PXY19459.1 hypothetical protein BAY60_32485 [Prauserella muralis]TWE29436.1 hypothetical protein FHX69_2121 [Prauserella muralis]
MAADAEQRRALRDRAGLALIDAAPQGWLRIDFRCRAVVEVHDATLSVLLNDGSYPAVPVPQEAVDALLRLRSAMYEPGEGTWFSARYLIDPPGRLHANYNLDFNPRWEPGIAPEGWVRDLEAFPRDAEHIPGWLRAELARARQGEAQ